MESNANAYSRSCCDNVKEFANNYWYYSSNAYLYLYFSFLQQMQTGWDEKTRRLLLLYMKYQHCYLFVWRIFILRVGIFAGGIVEWYIRELHSYSRRYGKFASIASCCCVSNNTSFILKKLICILKYFLLKCALT